MTEKQFFDQLAEKLEELFPKGECKERSQALVLNAYANLLFRRAMGINNKTSEPSVKLAEGEVVKL
jgi:hypothetical protein